MGLRRIAFAVGEPLLLTVDARTLLAFDARTGAPKWLLAFDKPLAAVVYTSLTTLPRAASEGPWRSLGSTSSAAVVVDVAGGVHAVDTGTGTLVETLDPAGPLTAVASSPDAFALATEEEVLLFRDGKRTALPCPAQALAFSRDATTLAIGARKELVVAAATTGTILSKVAVRGSIADVAATPAGGWLLATDRGIISVSAGGRQTASTNEDKAIAIALDEEGKGLALLRSGATGTTFDWVSKQPRRQLFADKGRALHDIAFGDGGVLGVAIEGGDAGIVDLSTRMVWRTEPHEGRPRHAGAVRVEQAEPPAREEGSITPERVGLSVAAAGILVILGLVAMGARSQSSPAPIPPCDEACGRTRLEDLRRGCAEISDPACVADAELALTSFEDGRCADASSKLEDIATTMQKDGGAPRVLARAAIARLGLATACASRSVGPRLEVVRLAGPGYERAAVEPISFKGGRPVALFVAPDGIAFVGSISASGSCVVRRKGQVGEWFVSHEQPRCGQLVLTGYGSTEVYVGLESAVWRYDVTNWTNLAFPGSTVREIAREGGGADVFVLDGDGRVWRYDGKDWSRETLPAANHVRLDRLVVAGLTVYASGADGGSQTLLRRAPSGVWSVLPRGPEHSFDPARVWWGAHDGQVFIADGASIVHTSDEGKTWQTAPLVATALWGRSSDDVFAGGAGSGIRRWNGKTWTAMPFDRPVSLIAGSASDLYVVAGTKQP